MKLVNLTPHTINIQLGSNMVAFPSEGNCRVSVKQNRLDDMEVKVGDVTYMIQVVENEYGEVEGLPDPQDGVVYIVSLMVINALKGKRWYDVVSPDSGAKAIRKDGQIVAVPGVVKG